MAGNMATVFYYLKIKAYDVPNYRIIHTPNCYAHIMIDSIHIFTTQTVSGSSPEWSECFEISVQQLSTIKVQLFHVLSSAEEVLRGTAVITVRDSLPRDSETVVRECKLHQDGATFHKGGVVIISLCRNLEKQSSSRLVTDSLEQNRIMTIHCLTVMNTQLKFNICEIADLSLLNEEIADLPKRIDACISDELRSACRSIGYHLAKVSNPNVALREAIGDFVSVHLLHWIEVMSLLDEVSKAETCLHTFFGWMKDHACLNANIHRLVEDAISLLRNYGVVIRLSALHTYFSALPLAPKTADLFKCFIHNVQRIPDIISSHPTWLTSSVRVLQGHSSCVNHVVFSPDGKKLASASDDKTVRLWGAEDGQSIERALKGHTRPVNHVVFSPDGKTLASASDDGTVRLWEVENDKALGVVLKGDIDPVTLVVFSPDGQKLASASSEYLIRLWDVESNPLLRKVFKGHTDRIACLIFSPDGKKIASASYDTTVRLWDVRSSETIGQVLKGHTGPVTLALFSPDGKKLASTSYNERQQTLRLWDIKSGHVVERALRGHTRVIRHVAFSPDGRKLASASNDRTVRLWDARSGRAIGEALTGHVDPVTLVVFSPNGTKVASVSSNRTVRLWDVKSGQAIGDAFRGHTDVVRHVSFSPDGMKLASASNDGTVRLCEVENDQAHEGDSRGSFYGVTSPAGKKTVFSTGNKLVSAFSGSTARLWGEESGRFISQALNGHTTRANHVVFSPNGRKLASASDDQTVRLWDVATGQAIGEDLKGHISQVNHVTFSPDGKMVASASNDKTVRLWEVESGKAIGQALTGHTAWVRDVVFSPNGKKLASASDDCTVKLWDVTSCQAIGPALMGHDFWVEHVVFSADGRKLASASRMTVWLWDADSGQALGRAFDGLTSQVTCLVFSADGEQLASVSHDKTVRLWSVENCREIGDPFNAYIDYNHHQGTTQLRILDIMSDARLRNFIFPPPYSDYPDRVELVSDAIDKIVEATMSFDELGFVQHGAARLVWLPVALRGSIAAWVRSSLIAVAGASGAITIIKLPDSI